MLLRDLHSKIVKQYSKKKIWFLPVGYVAKSGSAIAYFYKKQNGLKSDNFLIISDISKIDFKNDVTVFLDDFIGSGHQARELYDTTLRSIHSKYKNADIVFATVAGFEEGIRHLKANTRFNVLVADEIKSSETDIFNEIIFNNINEIARATEIIEYYGKKLFPEYPFGYANSKGLIRFSYSTPNNTLPIFWSTANGWKPLLPSGETYRDPQDLIGPPSGVPRNIKLYNSRRPLIESNLLDEYDLEEGLGNLVLDEFKTNTRLVILAPILKKLNITTLIFSKVIKIINRLRNEKHEKEPVRSAIFITKSDETINTLYINGHKDLTINDEKELVALVQLIDSYSGCTVIDSNGKVLGNMLHIKIKKVMIIFFLTDMNYCKYNSMQLWHLISI